MNAAMKQKSRILFFTLAGILLLTFGWFVLRPREPSYQGRTLTEWLKSAPSALYTPDSYTDEANAIRKIGNDAIPTLLRYAAAPEDSPFKKNILKWNDNLPPALSLPLTSKVSKHVLARIGFKILGPQARAAVPELVRLLKDDDEDVRITAAYCLGFIGPVAESAVPDLINEFDREKSAATNGYFVAAFALGQIGPSAQAAIPSLKAGLTNNSQDCRAISQIALINIHAISISPVIEQLKDTANVAQWTDAIEITRWCGTNAIPAVPLLISALNCTNSSIQSQSLSALGLLHQEPDVCVPAIVRFLSAKDDYLRQNAVYALRDFGRAAKPAVPALLRCLDDPEDAVRIRATNALREIDPEAAAKAGIK